jgi:hypothetical protein
VFGDRIIAAVILDRLPLCCCCGSQIVPTGIADVANGVQS